MAEDFKYQLSVKTGPGYEASMLNVRANDPDELAYLIEQAQTVVPAVVALQGSLQAAGAVASIAAPNQAPAIEATPPQVQSWAGPAATAGPEVLTDRYGGRWTYGLTDAPDLPDGRGKYVRHDWTSRDQKPYSAWKDPAAKGAPKPFTPSPSGEAPIRWIK